MTQKFTRISMSILAVITGLFAMAGILYQLRSEIDFEWYYGLGLTAMMIVLTYGFWKQFKWSAYLYIAGFLTNNIKALFEGTWILSPQLLVSVIILTVLALNFKNLR